MSRLTYRNAKLLADWGGRATGALEDSVSPCFTMCALCGSLDVRGISSTDGAFGPLAWGYCQGSICRRCGWWHVAGHYCEDDSLFESHLHFAAELVTFEVENLAIPAVALAHYLSSHYENITALPPRKFEELVGAVFREHLDCEVAMTKRTHDGGKDLVCVDASGGKFYVEAKNVAFRRAVSIDIVQRFVGVLYQNGVRHGILVTSGRFSNEAQAAAAKANEVGDLVKLELRDHTDVLAWLGALRDSVDVDILAKVQSLFPRQYGSPYLDK